MVHPLVPRLAGSLGPRPKINQDATPGKAHIVIREANSLPIVGGKIISVLGLLGLAANAAVIARGGRRRRQAR